MGWLGLALGARLVGEGYRVSGSTTRKERLIEIQKAGAVPKLIIAHPDLLVHEYQGFFGSDILIITLPPSSTNLPGQPSGRHSYHKPDGRFAQTIRTILTGKSIRPRHVVFTSSISVYGDVVGEVTENSPICPMTTSAKKVVSGENIVLKNFPESSVILRLGGLIGEDRNPIKYLAGRNNLPNGNTPVNLVHREDCISAIVEVIRQGAWGNVFNLVAPEHPLKRDYYPAVATKLGLAQPTFDTKDQTKGKKILSDRISKVLGYTFQYPSP